MGKESMRSWLTSNKKKLLLFVLLSLLIHLVFMMFFFRYDYHHTFFANLRRITDALTTPSSDKKNEINKRKIDAKHEQICASLRALKKQQDRGLPARLRAPKSNFGWVIFEEPPTPPQPQPLAVPTTLEGPVGQAARSQATEGKEGAGAKKTSQTAKQPHKKIETAPSVAPQEQPISTPVQQQSQKPKEITSIPQQKAPTPPPVTTSRETQNPAPTVLEPTPQKIVAQAQKVTDQPPQAGEQSVEERIAHIRDLQEKLGAFQSGALPTSSSRPTYHRAHGQDESISHVSEQREDRLIGGPGGIRIRGARSAEKQPKRNIIALTKGFIEKHYGEEGTDLIDRDGDPNKRPSFEELKYLSYESNISWCLQAAWKQNFSRRMMAHYPPRMEAVIEFTLDEHGAIANSTLLQSTGYTEIDTMIMENTKLASPFPPLPQHFGTKNYVTGRIIHVYADTANF
ncbi:MAG: TonB family protein [Candidatus Babeliales bacterium]|jgi:TonB family protein